MEILSLGKLMKITLINRRMLEHFRERIALILVRIFVDLFAICMI